MGNILAVDGLIQPWNGLYTLLNPLLMWNVEFQDLTLLLSVYPSQWFGVSACSLSKVL